MRKGKRRQRKKQKKQPNGLLRRSFVRTKTKAKQQKQEEMGMDNEVSSCFASICVPNLAGASSFIIFFFRSFLSFLFLGSFSFKVSLLLLLRYQRSSKVAEIPREKRNEEKAPGVWLGIRRFGENDGELPSSSFVGSIETKGEGKKMGILNKTFRVVKRKIRPKQEDLKAFYGKFKSSLLYPNFFS